MNLSNQPDVEVGQHLAMVAAAAGGGLGRRHAHPHVALGEVQTASGCRGHVLERLAVDLAAELRCDEIARRNGKGKDERAGGQPIRQGGWGVSLGGPTTKARPK